MYTNIPGSTVWNSKKLENPSEYSGDIGWLHRVNTIGKIILYILTDKYLKNIKEKYVSEPLSNFFK